MQSYISQPRGGLLYHLINFFMKILPFWFVMKNIGNYRKYDIFFDFCFTGNMIFPSIAENSENMIFTLSVFSKMLFFIQCQCWWFWKFWFCLLCISYSILQHDLFSPSSFSCFHFLCKLLYSSLKTATQFHYYY